MQTNLVMNLESVQQSSKSAGSDSSQDQIMIQDDEEEQLYTSIEEDGPCDHRLINEEWNPDAISYFRATISMSPFISYMCYKMKFIALPYLGLQMLSIPLAIKLRDKSGWIRWPSALIIVALLGGIKTASIQLYFRNDSVAMKGMFYAFTALWECSNAVCIFGGRALMNHFGINNYRRALFAAICPAQMKFIDQRLQREQWLRGLLHILGYLSTFFVLRLALRYIVETIEMNAFFEAEAIVICISCLVHIWNIPPLLWQMFMLGCKVQVIYPYGSIYFTKSSRDFWSKWSRPASSLIRHMFYYPLGGRRRAFLSIPLMFLLNASSHYGVSEALVGDKNEVGWNTVFCSLGLVAAFEVYCDSVLETVDSDDGTIVTNKWWARIRFVLAATSLRFAAYTLLHKCLNSSIRSLLGLLEA